MLLLKKRGLASFAIGVSGATVVGGTGWAYLVRKRRWTKLRVAPDTRAVDIYRSCGFALAPHGKAEPRKWAAVDVVTGRPTGFTTLSRPRCSADRSLIVGVDADGDLVTNRGQRIAANGHFGIEFALSPSGRWVAFYLKETPLTPNQLCITNTRNRLRHCYSKDAKGLDLSVRGAISVNNAGEVLLEQGYGNETCWYADEGALVSTKKFRSAGADQCFGVAIASGTSHPHVVIPLGSRPAWVSKQLLQKQFGVFK